MSAALIQVLISLLGTLIPAIAKNEALIDNIITSLEQIIPALVKEYQDLLPEVQNIIAALRGADGITQAQIDALDALEAKYDSDFDAAAQAEGFGTDPAA